MLADVRRLMAREGMPEPGQPLWVAVSGGVDSMVLLHVLRELGHACHVAHVDHGLRGAESDADRAFVEAHARQLGLPFRSVRVDVRQAAAQGASVQMAARELRYAWFKELLREGPGTIALGHHRDDAVETMLLNLLRGIGLHGAGGIPPVTKLPEGRICRPLLAVDRKGIMAYAETHGVAFRDDASNASPKYLRNRIRHQLLPVLEELRPGAANALARATVLLRELGAAAGQQLGREAAQRMPHGPDEWTFPLSGLRHSAAPTALLLHLLAELRPHPDLVEQLWEAVQAGSTGAQFMAGGKCITVGREHITVAGVADGFPTFSIPASQLEQGRAGPFQWKLVSVEEVDYGQGMATAWLDADRLTMPLLLRPWEPGDRMRPTGLRGSKLVSDILTDAGTARPHKQQSYVLVSGGAVVWLAGHRVAEGFSPAASTRNVLRILFSQ